MTDAAAVDPAIDHEASRRVRAAFRDLAKENHRRADRLNRQSYAFLALVFMLLAAGGTVFWFASTIGAEDIRALRAARLSIEEAMRIEGEIRSRLVSRDALIRELIQSVPAAHVLATSFARADVPLSILSDIRQMASTLPRPAGSDLPATVQDYSPELLRRAFSSTFERRLRSVHTGAGATAIRSSVFFAIATALPDDRKDSLLNQIVEQNRVISWLQATLDNDRFDGRGGGGGDNDGGPIGLRGDSAGGGNNSSLDFNNERVIEPGTDSGGTGGSRMAGLQTGGGGWGDGGFGPQGGTIAERGGAAEGRWVGLIQTNIIRFGTLGIVLFASYVVIWLYRYAKRIEAHYRAYGDICGLIAAGVSNVEIARLSGGVAAVSAAKYDFGRMPRSVVEEVVQATLQRVSQRGSGPGL